MDDLTHPVGVPVDEPGVDRFPSDSGAFSCSATANDFGIVRLSDREGLNRVGRQHIECGSEQTSRVQAGGDGEQNSSDINPIEL